MFHLLLIKRYVLVVWCWKSSVLWCCHNSYQLYFSSVTTSYYMSAATSPALPIFVCPVVFGYRYI